MVAELCLPKRVKVVASAHAEASRGKDVIEPAPDGLPLSPQVPAEGLDAKAVQATKDIVQIKLGEALQHASFSPIPFFAGSTPVPAPADELTFDFVFAPRDHATAASFQLR
jgi:hypothetical protein